MNASLFVLLFVLLLFFRFIFFLGGGQGVGVGFVFWGWACWNTVQRYVNAMHRTSECYSWQRKFDRRWFVCFVLFVLFFCVFYFIFIIFSGEGVGLAFLGVVDGV